MRVAWLMFLALAAHSPPDPGTARFGTFTRSHAAADGELPWKEITFFPGDLFTVRNLDTACEDEFGYGKYEQKRDTLILSQIISWSTGACRFEATENLIIGERRFLTRSSDSVSFQVKPIPDGQRTRDGWITLRKYGSDRNPNVRR